MTADFGSVADDGPKLSQSGRFGTLGSSYPHFGAVETHIGQNHTCSEMGLESQDGVTDVVEMWYLGFIKDDAILELTGIPQDGVIAHNNIFSDITTGSDLAAIADPGWPLDHRSWFNNSAVADVDGIADKGTPDLFPVNGWLETELEIGGDEGEGFPDVGYLLEK